MTKKKHGFILQKESIVEEVNGRARIFKHEKSGARLLHLANDDDNKVFSIFFRTPPEDSTGVAHILEHSVLCGSRKFPSKEPFVELLKGSLNTFLNAFTFSDKTGYPVASRNSKDFFNLMNVYLDAVFYPNIYRKPEIFLQEGWHYELEGPEDDLSYNGVVYNEMKGAFSSPEQILFRKIEQSLFPDTPYGVESGGDPDNIPDLTREQFLDFHRSYYHPANSFIYLYGNGDLDEQLAFLNDRYLADFERIKISSKIPLQKPFTQTSEMEVAYPVGSDEDGEDKAFFALNYVTGEISDTETVVGLAILNRILLQTPASPLKRALIEAGIGKDIMGVFDSEIRQPVFSIVVQNAKRDDLDRFQKLVHKTLEMEATNGLNKKLVAGALNGMEFKLREADYHSFPKGLVYNLQCMTNWLYGADPLEPLRFNKHLRAIKNKAENGYFENLIKKFLLENPHGSLVTLTPEQGLISRREKELQQKLDQYRKTLTVDEISGIVSRTEELRQYQLTPDSRENLDQIPLLQVDDIGKEAEKLPLEEKADADVETIIHPLFTNDIAYVDLYFDSAGVKLELIPYLGLLETVMGRMDTNRYDYMSLANELNIHLGDLAFEAQEIGEYRQSGLFYPKFTIQAKCLMENTGKMAELMGEVILASDFSDQKRLREIIRETRSRMEMDIMQAGHLYARRRAASSLSARWAYHEKLAGISFYQFIANLDDRFDELANDIVTNLQRTAQTVFQQNGSLTSITAEADDCPRVEDALATLVSRCPSSAIHKKELKIPQARKNEGFIIPGQVQYVAKCTDLGPFSTYDHRLKLLQTILSTDYLWNNVRVKGGAYGAACRFVHDGMLFFSSYRDPNLTKTLDIYDGVHDYLRDFKPEERELRKYIIGTIGRLDAPLTPSMKGERASGDYISHVSYEEQQRERDEILAATTRDLTSFADPMKNAMAQGQCCVIGSETKIRKNEQLFDSVSSLL
ncbi:MAG: insulinase family protein [Thermodesulfobacteriota bacterium]|nr:insulinase family protein [Thermodesulfobacteriota bacterium]